jgi:hypothetical protein
VAFLAGLLGLVWALSGPASYLFYFYSFLFSISFIFQIGNIKKRKKALK